REPPVTYGLCCRSHASGRDPVSRGRCARTPCATSWAFLSAEYALVGGFEPDAACTIARGAAQPDDEAVHQFPRSRLDLRKSDLTRGTSALGRIPRRSRVRATRAPVD